MVEGSSGPYSSAQPDNPNARRANTAAMFPILPPVLPLPLPPALEPIRRTIAFTSRPDATTATVCGFPARRAINPRRHEHPKPSSVPDDYSCIRVRRPRQSVLRWCPRSTRRGHRYATCGHDYTACGHDYTGCGHDYTGCGHDCAACGHGRSIW
ncbi:hypothetical protein MINT15_08430 [Saccharomonospora viridis]|uniref:Uncharacterized protein n=1 Tax=Saccharomonospora viridis TaxID=1852 RepID=A0A837DID0_9PSEU|nr:hypothetical protein MINT15_08430 [Saccharomonospora viridis]